jgi:hypothetical protein
LLSALSWGQNLSQTRTEVPQEEAKNFYPSHILSRHLVERDEARGVGSTKTGPAVEGRLVGDGELCKVLADHLGLDLNDVEDLAVVDSDDGANHLGEDGEVTKVGLDDIGLLVELGLLLGLPQLLDEGQVGLGETTGESPSDTGREELDDLVGVELEELLEVNTCKCERDGGPKTD